MTLFRRLFCSLFLIISILWISIIQAYAIDFQKIEATNEYPEIWYMPTHTVPTISMQISFPIGYAFDPEALSGLATMTAATMDEGAGDLDSDAFRKELSDNQISLTYSASLKRFTLNLNFLKFDKDTALKLAKLSLNKPRFDNNAIELMREQLTNNIETSSKNPNSLASNLLRQSYYKNHVFAKPSQGTLTSLKKITRNDLINFHKKLSLHNAFISVVGDISKDEILSFITELSSELPKKSDFNTTISDYTIKPYSDKINVYFDVPQSTILMATPSVKRTDDTFFATYIATHILGGGGFGSHLVNDLREKKGLTYSISSYLDSSLHDGRMLIQFATDNKNVDVALAEVQKTLKRIAKEGITEKELKKAKANLKGQYLLTFETNNDITSLAQSLYNYGLPYNYTQKREALFDAVTVNDVNKAIRKLFLQPLTIITVGGNKHIQDFKPVSINDIKF